MTMSQWDQLRTVALSEINARFSCPLCQGYIIDSVTAEECGHAYCRSCIARHIANGTVTCPKCTRLINSEDPGEPFQKLKSDPVLQRLIYKLVPNLVSKETERRATYLGSEKVARKEVKLSVGNDALFFNERSCVCIELKQRTSTTPTTSLVQQTSKESCFLRMELSAPLCILVDYIKLRTGTNYKVCLSSSPKASVLDPDLRLVDLAYLIAWDMTRPLPVYYELIDSNNQPAGRLQPLTPMLRTESKAEKPLNNRSETSSSILVRTGGKPDYASTSAGQNQRKSQAGTGITGTSVPTAKIKLKFNKNQVGNWQAIPAPAVTSVGLEESVGSLAYGALGEELRRFQGKAEKRQKRLQNSGHAPKRPFDQTRDPVIIPKVAKVLPFPSFPSPPIHKEYNDFLHRSDPESEILKSTGLVPFGNTSSGNQILTIRHILHGHH